MVFTDEIDSPVNWASTHEKAIADDITAICIFIYENILISN